MSKFKTNLARRDPEKVERLRAILDPLFDTALTELQELVAQPIPEEVIQLKDPRAGEKFVEAHRRKMSTLAARKRVIGEHLSLVERILDLTGRDISGEQEAIQAERDDEKALLLKMLRQVKRNDPTLAEEIEEETEGAYEFVAPRNRKPE